MHVSGINILLLMELVIISKAINKSGILQFVRKAVAIEIFFSRKLARDDNLCILYLFIDMIYSRREFFNS